MHVVDWGIPRRENSVVVVTPCGSRCCSEEVLMRWEAGPLVGLEHIVSPTIGMGDIYVWLHRTRGIINICECRFLRASNRSFRASHIRGAIHRANTGAVHIALSNERRMDVSKTELDTKRNGPWIGRPGFRGLIQPPRCLDVVLLGRWVDAARAWVCWWAQSLEQLSGVRFSWMTMITCWKAEIWADAGVARASAASIKGNSRFMHFLRTGL